MDDRVHRNQLSLLLKGGVTTFVCLQAEFDPYVSEMEWKRCQKLRPYFGDAVAIVRQSKQLPDRRQHLPQDADTMQFVYFPIIDQNVAPDADVMLLLEDLYARIQKGEVLYVHCWGGHGRAGTVAACLMAILDGLDPREALANTQKYHDTRLETSEYRCKIDSPQRPSQRAQVKRLIEAWQAKYGVAVAENRPPKVAQVAEGQELAPKPEGNPRGAQRRSPTNASKGGIDYQNGVRQSFEGSQLGGQVTPPSGGRHPGQLRGKQTRLFPNKSPQGGMSMGKNTSPKHKAGKGLRVDPSLSLPASYRFPGNGSPTNCRVPASPTNVHSRNSPERYTFPAAKRLSKATSFSDGQRR